MVIAALVAVGLAATPLEASTERVRLALKRELAANEVELDSKSEHLVVRLTAAGHARIDAVWKILGAVAQESRGGPAANIIVEVTGEDVATCLRRERGAADYLFGKQRVSFGRVKLEPCSVPDTATVGELAVESREFLVGEYSDLDGVAFYFTNAGEKPIEVTFDQLELVPAPRTVQLTSFWFRSTAGGEITEVKKGKQLTVPPKSTLEVMLRFTPVKERLAWQRRLSGSTAAGRFVVRGAITRIGFFE